MKKQWLKGGFGMELRQLKYFLAVADARSFVSAAGELFVSRQAVSKAVGQLEAELGVELFDFSSALDGAPPYGNQFPYGAHPNGEGGRVAAEAFLRAEYWKPQA